MTYPATPYAGVMTGGHPEPSGLACADSLKASKERTVSKERFIADKVRVRNSKIVPGAICVEVREHRTCEPSLAMLHPDEAIRLIAALSAALSNCNRDAG